MSQTTFKGKNNNLSKILLPLLALLLIAGLGWVLLGGKKDENKTVNNTVSSATTSKSVVSTSSVAISSSQVASLPAGVTVQDTFSLISVDYIFTQILFLKSF